MENSRLNNKVFSWAYHKAREGKKTAVFHIMKFYSDTHMDHLCNINNVLNFHTMKEDVNLVLSEYYESLWYTKISRELAINGQGRNKLRTYRTFKQSFETEPYVQLILSRKQRQALSKFHCGVAPLRIETGRCELEEEQL
jgi:hypothetical protein